MEIKFSRIKAATKNMVLSPRGKRWTTVGIMLLAIVTLSFLLYWFVWRPLHQELILPEGVETELPSFDEASLETIKQQQLTRTRSPRPLPDYTDRLFKVNTP
jgi:hypothetical protein